MSKNDKSYINIQYVSDLHLDTRPNGIIPLITASCEYLLICGDIGLADNYNYNMFFDDITKKFVKIFVVLGNHDYNISRLYNHKKVIKWTLYIESILKKYNNVIILNESSYNLDNNYVIIGTTLWSNPIYETKYDIHEFNNHIAEHNRQLLWLEKEIEKYNNKNIIIATHYVPSFKLIENKYRINETITDQNKWYATNCEHLINSSIKAWICGHTHSIIEMIINNVYCGINAVDYGDNNLIVSSKILHC